MQPTFETGEAYRICSEECPVRVECLEYSLRERLEFGIWGGLSPTERTRLLRRLRNTSGREWHRAVKRATNTYGGFDLTEVRRLRTKSSRNSVRLMRAPYSDELSLHVYKWKDDRYVKEGNPELRVYLVFRGEDRHLRLDVVGMEKMLDALCGADLKNYRTSAALPDGKDGERVACDECESLFVELADYLGS